MNRRTPILLGWGLFILLSILVLMQGPEVQSDLGQFLPKNAKDGPDLLLDTLRDSPASRLLLVDLSGAPAQELAEAARSISTTLASSPHFQHVLGADSRISREEQDLLFKYRYMLHPTDFNESTLRESLQQRLKEIALGAPLDHQQLRADPTAQYRQVLQHLISNGGPDRHLGVWFSDDREHAMLLLHSAYPAFAMDEQEQALAAVDNAFSRLEMPQLKLVVTGPPLFAVESRERIRGGAQQLTIWASLGVTLLIFIAYRSPAATLLVAMPLFSGIVAGATAVVLLFGQLHGIALAFGITIIGITVDYPIHLFSHGGRQYAAQRIWPTLRLGVVTTAIGFSTLLFSDFQGLTQMGLFAISGILVAAVVTRWVLPVLPSTEHTIHSSLMPLINSTLFAARRIRLGRLLPLLMLLSVAYAVQQGDDLWESQINRLSPIPAAQLEQDRVLRDRLHAAEPGQLLVIQGDNLEALLQQSEVLVEQLEAAQKNQVLKHFNAPSRYLPSRKRQLEYRQALPESEELIPQLTAASQGLAFRPGVFQPFIKDTIEAKALEPLNIDSLSGTITGLRLNSLLRRHEGGWYALITLGGVTDEEAVTRIASTTGARYLDVPREASEMVKHYRDEALQLTGLGVILILLVLALSLRAAGRLFRVALPVFSAIAVTAATLSLLGEQLSLFHLASLLLVLGIGLDYGLFFDRCQNAGGDCSRTTGALLICCSTTLLVFGLLAASPLPVLHAIGLTVSLGVLSTLLFTLGSGTRT